MKKIAGFVPVFTPALAAAGGIRIEYKSFFINSAIVADAEGGNQSGGITGANSRAITVSQSDLGYIMQPSNNGNTRKGDTSEDGKRKYKGFLAKAGKILADLLKMT